MTTIDTHAPAASSVAVDRGSSSIVDWLTTTDHKRIGRAFVVCSLLGVVTAAVLGVLLGLDRASTDTTVLSPGAVEQVFSGFRVGLIYLGVAPLVLGVALAVVPLQLGARSLAFPVLAAAGFWTWLVGSVMAVISIAANGGPGGGNHPFVALFLTAHILQLLGLIAVAGCLATSIMTTRAPGMNLRRVPPFSWSVLVASVGVVLVFPVQLGNTLVTYLDYRYGRMAFGGNKGILAMIGDGLTQPLVAVLAVPALGFALEAVAVATRQRLPLRGVAFTGLGLVGVGAFAALTQASPRLPRDVFSQDLGGFISDVVPWLLFSALPVLGGVVVIGIVALTLRGARPRLISPLVFGLFGALLVVAGLVANAVDRIGDARLGGTVFEEAATLLVAYGTVVAVVGAFVYWCPKWTGRLADDRKVLPLALLAAAGAVLAAGSMAIAGFAKQPGMTNIFDYSGPTSLWNVLNAVGHVLVAVAVLGVVALRLNALRSGPAAGDDPWDGQTLEWATSSPAPTDNFAAVHTVVSPEPLIDLKPGGHAR